MELKLEGEFSSATAPARRCLLNTLYESGERDFIVDLTDVDGDEEVINTVLPP